MLNGMAQKDFLIQIYVPKSVQKSLVAAKPSSPSMQAFHPIHEEKDGSATLRKGASFYNLFALAID